MRKFLQCVVISGAMLCALLPVAANAQPGGPALERSKWVGSEQLEGYGELEFHYRAGGVVIMIDTDGANQGTFRQVGSEVTMTFYDGRVVYQGRIQGNTMTGTGRNQRGSWNFTVSVNGSTGPLPPSPLPPAPLPPGPTPPGPPSPPLPPLPR
ncbi:MAG: hypothetical protein HYR84_04805 [Planctomycetes bacterium]|nr:hypothetical protein [Planctomycetota bacterium]